MTESESRKPEEILREILASLQSDDPAVCLNAIAQLRGLNYSSEAIRNKLEKLAANDNREVRREALAALDLASHRHIRRMTSKIATGNRLILLNEINDWEKRELLDTHIADVLRRRYDFDIATVQQPAPAIPTPPTPAPVQPALSKSTLSDTGPGGQRQGVEERPAQPSAPAQPRPTLTQTLLSETSIKIALYLGAFFVIAAAAILAALSPAARLPVLIIATLIFGGLSIAIRKRLPQPSFALFIVFSFLLPITANVLEESLNLTSTLGSIYWVMVSLFMTIIWGGSAWLFESRVFSVTSFIAFLVAFHNVGKAFDAEPQFFLAMDNLAALGGLLGVWILKKWRDGKFALPLFTTTQIAQFLILGISFAFYIDHLFAGNPAPLWNLAGVLVWGFALAFFVLSDFLFPFLLFSLLAPLTLLPIPWFVGAAFEIESPGLATLFLFWGLILSIISEAAHRFEATRKFSLPLFAVFAPTFLLASINGFIVNISTGFAATLGIGLVYTALHVLRPRWWVWTLALLDLIIAYLSFFELPLIEKADVFFGFQALGLGVLLLWPGLLWKNDLKTHPHWRLPPLAFGAFFTLLAGIFFLAAKRSDVPRSAIGFGVLTIFFALYAVRQRKAAYGYIPAAYLALTVIYTLHHFELDAWLPALTALAVFYFIAGIAIRSKEAWSLMARNSALILGGLVAFAALIGAKESGGWYSLVPGLLFAIEMYLRRNGWFEAGMPIMFTIGASLILRDFEITEPVWHLLAHSLVWLGADMLAHLTFANPRPLKFIVRGIGAILSVVNYGFLFFDADAGTGAIGFGIYALLFLTVSLLYRQPTLFYTFTLTLPLFVTFVFRSFEIVKWIHPVIFVAMAYYAAGFFLRLIKRASGWDSTLLYSGLGVGAIVSIAAPILGGADAAIPVTFAATMWAAEAFARKNAWLGFPANGLYLLAYFIILGELNVDQPQFYSMGAALLGLFQHYLLTRAESKTGTFLMGMVSQLILLGTTYIQMVGNEQLIYFVVLFFQSIAVLVYGVIIRSRSLTFTPIVIVVIGVITVLYSALKGLNTVVLIGCTGVILLTLGILAVLMRERIAQLGDKLSDWKS